MTAMCIGIGMGAALIWENLTAATSSDTTNSDTTRSNPTSSNATSSNAEDER